jgi:hypothetical protein
MPKPPGKKRLTLDDFPLPKKLSADDFADLCETHHVPSQKKKYIRGRLDALFDELAGHMRGGQPDRKADIEQIMEAQTAVKRHQLFSKALVRMPFWCCPPSHLLSPRCYLPDGSANISQTMISRLSQGPCR